MELLERAKQEIGAATAGLRAPRGAEPCYAMAALLACGGFAGFAARRSKPSLIAGVVLGSGFGASGYAIASDSPTLSRRGCIGALVLSTLTATVMGKRALSSRRLVKTLEVGTGGQIHAQYSAHFQQSLAAYANPRNIVWMPGGIICVASSASAVYHVQEYRQPTPIVQ